MGQHNKMLVLQITIQLLTVMGVIYYWNTFNIWWGLVTFLGITIFAFCGLCCYLHRYCSHKSFELDINTERVLHFLSILLMQGSAILWASNHITHHKYPDKEGDPHPALDGWKTWFWWNTYKNSKLSSFTAKRMLKNKMYRYTHENYFKIYFTLMFISMLISPKFTLYFILIPVMYTFHATSFVNVITHSFGYRNFDTPDKSTNTLIPFFDGLHNNHHKYPNRYNTSIKWYEIDFSACIISVYKFLSRAKNSG